MSADLQQAQKLAADMAYLAKTLRQLGKNHSRFNNVDVMSLGGTVRLLQDEVYRIAERLDLLDSPPSRRVLARADHDDHLGGDEE